MRNWSRALMVAALAALIGTLALAATSTAHKRVFKSTASFTLNTVPKTDVASGRVGPKACRAKRAVILFEDKDPNVAGGIRELGRTTSTASGFWSVPVKSGVKAGRTYWVKVKKKRMVKNKKHMHFCKWTRSQNLIGQ